MEEKMENMQKWVERKKRKLNVVMWLNSNLIPTIGFLEWVNTCLIVKAEHFENLLENTLFHTIQQIFEENLCEKTDFIYPISCFNTTKKLECFIFVTKNEDGTPEWRQLVLSDMILILKTIQNGMIKELIKMES